MSIDPQGPRSRIRLGSSGPDGRGHLSARILAFGQASARVALVSEGALLLAGDLIEVDVSVGPDATLDLIEPSGTVAYDMRGGSAQWSVRIHLAERARLRWHGKPFVVAAGAVVSREVHVDLAAGAMAVLRETLVLGRSGEPGGSLTQRTRVSHEGHPLLVEDLLLGEHRQRIGLLGPWRVVDTLSVLGRRLEETVETATPTTATPTAASPKAATVVANEPHWFELEGPGTVIRSLSRQAHLGCLEPLWQAVADTSDHCLEPVHQPITGYRISS